MSYYMTKQIYPWLYSIRDPDNVFCYLLVGEKRALLYDTAYGIGSLPDTIRAITDKPYDVVLGHGHVDHANGAYQFGEVYLHEDDVELCREHTSRAFREGIAQRVASGENGAPEGFDAKAYADARTDNLKKLDIGTVFDLGGLHAEVIGMEGHTKGSVGLLIKEKRVLLDSDAANNHNWMFLGESLLIDDYVAMLERVYKLDFDTFFVGHSDEARPKADFVKFMKVARNASIEKAEPYSQFEELKPYFYQEDGVGIVFNERTRG